jgi:tRNA G10  N-methylase Trm11
MPEHNLPAPYYSGRGITLYHADFKDILPAIGSDSIDALICDPPYGNTNLAWDKTIDWKFFWTESHRLCKPNAPIVLFASGKFVYELIHTNPETLPL